jgi:branched-chain amino acid transport system ATP-binding protein
MSGHVLKINGMSAGYGPATILREVSLTVPAGGVTCLLGANGAGKTTMLRAISGAIWRKGVIELDGRDIGTVSTAALARRGVAHVPDGRGTFLDLTVEENLRVGGYIAPGEKVRRERIDRIYQVFGRLKERRSQQAGTLSGGEQQMLAIGRALMQAPKLLLLDEPSFGLAPIIVRELFQTMARINRETGMGILVVEQNARLALDISNRAYVLEGGAITIGGTSEQVSNTAAIQCAYLGRA